MSTPGRRRALRALSRAKVRNEEKAAHGETVTIDGHKESASTYKHKFGLPRRLRKAKRRRKAKG